MEVRAKSPQAWHCFYLQLFLMKNGDFFIDPSLLWVIFLGLRWSFQWLTAREEEQEKVCACQVAWWCWWFSHSVVSHSVQPHELKSARLLRLWDSPDKNTGVDCHFLLQGIFPTQGWNIHLLRLQNQKVNSLLLVPPGMPRRRHRWAIRERLQNLTNPWLFIWEGHESLRNAGKWLPSKKVNLFMVVLGIRRSFVHNTSQRAWKITITVNNSYYY